MLELKVKAFTLFESVIAVTIITVCLGIGTIIYSNVLQSDKSLAAMEGQFEISSLFKQVKTNKHYFPEVYNYQAYNIIQTVSIHNGIERLYHISFDVVIGQQKIYSKQFLLYDPES